MSEGAVAVAPDSEAALEARMKASAEAIRRLCTRISNPNVILKPPMSIDINPNLLVVVDLAAMDRACLPEMTTQVCLAIASNLSKRIVNSGMAGPVNELLLVKPDGRLVGIAESRGGERLILEEFWTDKRPGEEQEKEASDSSTDTMKS